MSEWTTIRVMQADRGRFGDLCTLVQTRGVAILGPRLEQFVNEHIAAAAEIGSHSQVNRGHLIAAAIEALFEIALSNMPPVVLEKTSYGPVITVPPGTVITPSALGALEAADAAPRKPKSRGRHSVQTTSDQTAPEGKKL